MGFHLTPLMNYFSSTEIIDKMWALTHVHSFILENHILILRSAGLDRKFLEGSLCFSLLIERKSCFLIHPLNSPSFLLQSIILVLENILKFMCERECISSGSSNGRDQYCSPLSTVQEIIMNRC